MGLLSSANLKSRACILSFESLQQRKVDLGQETPEL